VSSEAVIIGAGPAGLSCALWLRNSGYSALVLEQAPECGGMLRLNHHANDWLLGFPNATGRSIRQRFMEHLSHHDFAIVTSAVLTGLQRRGSGFAVAYSAPGQAAQEVAADFLVIASGTRARAPLELARLASQIPRQCLIGPGEFHADDFSAGQSVAMLGGGDNAFENAWHLAQHGVKVDIYYRGQARAQREWRHRCAAIPSRITLYPQTATAGFAAQGSGVAFRANGEARQADAVVVMYGYEPNTGALTDLAAWLRPVINREGFVEVDEYQCTAIANLYAAGDVTHRPLPCLPSAIGQGSVAAKAIVLKSGELPS
jgi:thioredoxin reductase